MAAVSSTSTAYSSQPELPTSTAHPTTNAAAINSLARRPRRSDSFVMLEASSASGGGVARTKSLTEDDLEELKGCVDLGFGFAYSGIPELCGTLPALELCYSMTRRFLNEQRAPGQEREEEPASPPLPNWRIFAPGDDPEEVKARLKYWAQADQRLVSCCLLAYATTGRTEGRLEVEESAGYMVSGFGERTLFRGGRALLEWGGIMIRDSDTPRLGSMI